jgi:hypothetical protein
MPPVSRQVFVAHAMITANSLELCCKTERELVCRTELTNFGFDCNCWLDYGKFIKRENSKSVLLFLV